MKKVIIGIVGKKNSGKDTICSMINYIQLSGITNATYKGWVGYKVGTNINKCENIISFGDNLKKVCSILFNIQLKHFYERDHKDVLWYCFETNTFIKTDKVSHCQNIDNDYKYISMNDILNSSFENCINDKNYKFHCIKLRTIMQYVGTNICRNNISHDIWIKNTIGNIMNLLDTRNLCIVSDIRFDNELKAININNDVIKSATIKIIRNNSNNSDDSFHESESLNCKTDYEINNDSTYMSLFYKVKDVYYNIINK